MRLQFNMFQTFTLGGTKVLVTTGFGPRHSGIRNSEIIDLEDPSFRCTISQFPTSASTATGGLVGNAPLICGGGWGRWNNVDKSCYSLKEDGTWKHEKSSDLSVARRSAANGFLTINNKLVIAGGIDGKNKRLATIIREHLYQTQVMGNDSDKILYDIV